MLTLYIGWRHHEIICRRRILLLWQGGSCGSGGSCSARRAVTMKSRNGMIGGFFGKRSSIEDFGNRLSGAMTANPVSRVGEGGENEEIKPLCDLEPVNDGTVGVHIGKPVVDWVDLTGRMAGMEDAALVDDVRR